MKLNSLLIMFVLHFPMLVFSQFKHDIGISSSWRQFNYLEQQMNYTGEYNVHLNKFTAAVGIGVEYWYIKKSTFSNPSLEMKPTYIGKIESWLGFESKLFNSGVFFSANIGTRFYCFNQLENSLSLSDNYRGIILHHYSRQTINGLPNYYPNSNVSNKAQFYYVTKMPITFLTRVNLGYAFKRFKVSAFIMPYWVRFHYENATYPERKGKTSIFFYDLGLGVNYTLPQKKKE